MKKHKLYKRNTLWKIRSRFEDYVYNFRHAKKEKKISRKKNIVKSTQRNYVNKEDYIMHKNILAGQFINTIKSKGNNNSQEERDADDIIRDARYREALKSKHRNVRTGKLKEKLKTFFSVIALLLFLPYVITIFYSGLPNLKYDQGEDETSQVIVNVMVNGTEQTIELEEYIAGILAGQISAEYEPETLKMQAVIARTNLLNKYEEDEGGVFEEAFLSGDEMRGVFGEASYLEKQQKILLAVEDTRGEVVTWNGELPELPYHAVSAGVTRSGEEALFSDEYSYLPSVESERDIEAEGFMAMEVFSPEEIINACKEEFPDLETEEGSLIDQIVVVSRDQAQYVSQIQVGNIRMSGEHFRKCLDLNSSCFTLQEQDGGVRIITKGLGHGVGASQYGANILAKQGMTYESILETYYNEIKIENYYE